MQEVAVVLTKQEPRLVQVEQAAEEEDLVLQLTH
jgi:hypothetical protein